MPERVPVHLHARSMAVHVLFVLLRLELLRVFPVSSNNPCFCSLVMGALALAPLAREGRDVHACKKDNPCI